MHPRGPVWGEHIPTPVPSRFSRISVQQQNTRQAACPTPSSFTMAALSLPLWVVSTQLRALSKLSRMHTHRQGGLTSTLPTTSPHISSSCTCLTQDCIMKIAHSPPSDHSGIFFVSPFEKFLAKILIGCTRMTPIYSSIQCYKDNSFLPRLVYPSSVLMLSHNSTSSED